MRGIWPIVIAQRRWLIQAAGSAVLLGLVFWILPLEAVTSAIGSIDPLNLVVALAVFVVAHIAAALKWSAVLGRDMPTGLAVRAHFAGLAANLCLPGAVGGDVVRAGLAHQAVPDKSHLVAVAMVDRLIDMLALVTLAFVGLLLSQINGVNLVIVAQAALALIGISAVVLALPKLLPIPWRLVPKLPGRRYADKLALAFNNISRAPGFLLLIFASSLGIQTLLVSLSWWLALSVGAQVSLANWVFAWPLAKLIAVLPISLNGLGVREATLASILGPFGANPVLIVAAGLVWQAVLFMAGAIGALVLLFSRLLGKDNLPNGRANLNDRSSQIE